MSTIIPEEIADLMDSVCKESLVTYLYLIVDITPDRDYIKRYRVVLSKFILSIKSTNPQVIIILYEALPD